MKKIIALLLALIMVFGLVACAAKEAAPAEKEEAPAAAPEKEEAPAEDKEEEAPAEEAAPAEGLKVAISVAEYNDWNKLYEAVIAQKCDEWGWTYEIFDAKQDASTQIDQVNSIIAQGFDAMTIQAVDNAALAPVVGQAADNGVIVVDHYGFADELGISEKIYKVLFGQKEAGILQAEEYIKLGGDTPTVDNGNNGNNGNNGSNVPATDPSFSTTAGTVVKAAKVNLRKEPGTKYEKSGTVSKGDRVVITETAKVGSATWGKTEKGWIHMYYVKLDSKPLPEGATYKIVTVNGLNIRAGAGVNYDKVGTYRKGEVIVVYELTKVGDKDWGRTDKGWISLEYTK